MQNINVDVEVKKANGMKKVIIKFPFPGCGCPKTIETAWLDVADDEQDVVLKILQDAERAMRRNVFCNSCGQPWPNSFPKC